VKATAAYYRRHALRSRELAQKVRDKEVKTHLLSVAEQYERLGDEAEQDQPGRD
jgi:hypothetical protein